MSDVDNEVYNRVDNQVYNETLPGAVADGGGEKETKPRDFNLHFLYGACKVELASERAWIGNEEVIRVREVIENAHSTQALVASEAVSEGNKKTDPLLDRPRKHMAPNFSFVVTQDDSSDECDCPDSTKTQTLQKSLTVIPELVIPADAKIEGNLPPGEVSLVPADLPLAEAMERLRNQEANILWQAERIKALEQEIQRWEHECAKLQVRIMELEEKP